MPLSAPLSRVWSGVCERLEREGPMFHRIVEFAPMLSAGGQWYRPRVYGDRDASGTWDAWVVFFPIASGRVISTTRETTQTSYGALQRWALTLDQVYLEGALDRAVNTNTGVAMPSLGDLAQEEVTAAADVIALHRPADRAAAKAASEIAVAEMHERAAATARANAAEF